MNVFLDEKLPKNKDINILERKEAKHPLLQFFYKNVRTQEKDISNNEKLISPKSTQNNSFFNHIPSFLKNINQNQNQNQKIENQQKDKGKNNVDSNDPIKKLKTLSSDNSSSNEEESDKDSKKSSNKNNYSKSTNERKSNSQLGNYDTTLPYLSYNKHLFKSSKKGENEINLYKTYHKKNSNLDDKNNTKYKITFTDKVFGDKTLFQKDIELSMFRTPKNNIELKDTTFKTNKNEDIHNSQIKNRSKINLTLERNDINLNSKFNKRKSISYVNKINIFKKDKENQPKIIDKLKDAKKRKSFIGFLPKNDNLKNIRTNTETLGDKTKINIKKILYKKNKLKEDSQIKGENDNQNKNMNNRILNPLKLYFHKKPSKDFNNKKLDNNYLGSSVESSKTVRFNNKKDINNNPLTVFFNSIVNKTDKNVKKNFFLRDNAYSDIEYIENSTNFNNNIRSSYCNINSIFKISCLNRDEEKYMKKKRLNLIIKSEKILKGSYLYNAYNDEIKNYFLKNCVIDKVTEIIFDNFEPLENKEENKNEQKLEKEKYKKKLFEQVLNKSYKYLNSYENILKIGASFLKQKNILTKVWTINNYILDIFDIYPKLLKQFEEKWFKKEKKNFFYKLLFDYFSTRNRSYVNKSNKNYSISLEKDFFIFNQRINTDLNLTINALNLEKIHFNKNSNIKIKSTNTFKIKLHSKPILQHKSQSISLLRQATTKERISTIKLKRKSSNPPDLDKKIENILNIKQKYGFVPKSESFEKFAKLYRIPKMSSKKLLIFEKKNNKENDDKIYKTINSEKEQMFNNMKLNMDNYNILKNRRLFHYKNNKPINLNKRFSEMVINKKNKIQLDKKLKIDSITIKFAGIDQLTQEASLIKTQEIEKDLPDVKLFDKFVSFIQRRKINQFDLLIQKKEEAFNRILNKQEFSTGNTLLIYATQNNLKSLVELLLLKGADPNLQNKFGNSALHIAFKNDNAFIINLLLQYKAEQKLKNTNGLFPWQMSTTINN